MVGSGTKEIFLQWGLMVNGKERSKGSEFRKPFGQEVTIGRGEENDVAFPSMFLFISNKHGKIASSSKFFGIVSSVVYQDHSKYGTWYLPQNVTDVSKAIKVHNTSVEIASGCKLLFLDPKGEKSGVSMFVLF